MFVPNTGGDSVQQQHFLDDLKAISSSPPFFELKPKLNLAGYTNRLFYWCQLIFLGIPELKLWP
ncbi:MAG: hypothetical protein CSB24_03395 [Deltaproteobacteria bacterium]|nr:MAG: hypothetical protein CSB24_03395 [Deltaproteobacteria bacterium]